MELASKKPTIKILETSCFSWTETEFKETTKNLLDSGIICLVEADDGEIEIKLTPLGMEFLGVNPGGVA